jgi:hypothetical protein
MDLTRLVKLLNLTTSDNDHEALLAIRQANLLVNGNWSGVIAYSNSNPGSSQYQQPRPEPRPPKQEPKRQESTINGVPVGKVLEIISANMGALHTNNKKWFHIMNASFVTQQGVMTERQLTVLAGLWEEVIRRT